jgi:hypothetical protein
VKLDLEDDFAGGSSMSFVGSSRMHEPSCALLRSESGVIIIYVGRRVCFVHERIAERVFRDAPLTKFDLKSGRTTR